MLHHMRQIFIYLIIAVACFNACCSLFNAISSKNNPHSFPLHRLAEPFVGLKPIFKDQHAAGYITDKNLDIPLAIAQYQLAQFTLAPTILHLNKSDTALALIDATDSDNAKRLVNEYKLTPLKMSNQGLILAINPQYTNTP